MANDNDTRDYNNPNQGFNVKTFMIAVLIGLIVIILGLYFFVTVRNTQSIPKVNKPEPNSRLMTPAGNEVG